MAEPDKLSRLSAIIELTMHTALAKFDSILATRIQQWSPRLRPWFILISFFGLPKPISLLAVVLTLIYWLADQHSLSLAFIGVLVAMGFCTLLKLSLRRSRPDGLTAHKARFKSYSFPSGHSFGAAVFYGLLAYIGSLALQPAAAIISAALLLIMAIGLSRVYLRAHYPSDTIGGWLLGFMSLGLIILITAPTFR